MMKNESYTSHKSLVTNNMSDAQRSARSELGSLFSSSPIPQEELLDCIAIFQSRQQIQRFLFLNQIYQEQLNVHGVIMEFGTRWGVNLANILQLRSIYEPYNPTRKIIGFDTFTGFPAVSEKDGSSASIKVGSHNTVEDYALFLERVLQIHESDAPISHLQRFEIVVGDATETVAQYLQDHPETLISFAYFDFDIYLPTKSVLEQIMERLVKGCVVAFDELNYHRYPGETEAFLEVLGAGAHKLIRSPNSGSVSYLKYR